MRSRTNSRAVRVLLVAAAIALLAAPKLWSSAALGRLLGQQSSARDLPSGVAQRRGAEPVLVTTEVLVPSSLAETVSSTGTLLAAESVELQPEVPGRITVIDFVEGARVQRGALLVKLNDADLQARRVAVEHELALATRRERRIGELLAKGFVVPDDHDEAVSAVLVRRAEISLIDAQIAKTEIRAPFDGIAGLRSVSEGAMVSAGTQIATLQRVDTLKVDFAIPEKYAERVRVGSPIAFTLDGRPEEFGGEVYAYDPRIDEDTRTLLIRALCPNPGGALLPGAFANVKLTLNEISEALMVPAEALIPDYDASHVFVVKHGKAEQRPVVTGIRTASRVQIVAGLEPGDVVVTSGLLKLRSGSAVSFAREATDPVAAWPSEAAPR